MSLLYEPREKDERVFIDRMNLSAPNNTGGVWIMLCDGNGRDVNAACMEIGPKGIHRFSNDETKALDCAHDEDGCIALHPDDPAMRKIAELEGEVERLTKGAHDEFDAIVGTEADLAAAQQRVTELEARVNELEAPTVAPELTDEEGKRLWRLYVNTDGSTLDGMRAMIAAYEKMRRPLTDEDVERAAEAAFCASYPPLPWAMATPRDKRVFGKIARAVLETVL